MIRRALTGVESLLAEYGLHPDEPVHRPGWYATPTADGEKRRIRARTGRLVEMEWGSSPPVREDEVRSVRSRDHLTTGERVVTAPLTGLLVGVLENPVAAPGHPLRHRVRLESVTRGEIERRRVRRVPNAERRAGG